MRVQDHDVKFTSGKAGFSLYPPPELQACLDIHTAVSHLKCSRLEVGGADGGGEQSWEEKRETLGGI